MRERKVEMLKLSEQGYSYAEIATMFGTSRQNVRETLLREPKKKRPLPFMVVDGIKFSLNKYGYYRCCSNGISMSMHRYVYEKHFGKMPDGYIIHHIDEDKGNNDISNLKMLTTAEHNKLHGSVYNFDDDTIAEIQELRKTTSVKDLSEKYGCSESTAGLLAGTLVPEKGTRHTISKKREYTQEEIQQMVEMHKTMGVREISHYFKCRTGAVSAFLNEFEPKVIDTRTKAEKAREYNLKYREEHREELLAKDNERYANNAEKLKSRQRVYFENNREKVCEAAKDYYRRNKEARLAYAKKRHEEMSIK